VPKCTVLYRASASARLIALARDHQMSSSAFRATCGQVVVLRFLLSRERFR
jgi:hypothetical protein